MTRLRIATLGSTIATAAASLAAPAGAAQGQRQVDRVGEWAVAMSMPGSCVAARDFPGRTRIYVSLGHYGWTMLAVANPAWTIKDGQLYKTSLTVDGKRLELVGTGLVEGEWRGLSLSIGSAFLDQLAAGRFLEVSAPEAEVGARLELTGSAAAIGRLRGCVSETAIPGYRFPPPVPPPAPPAPPRELGKARRAEPKVPLHQLVTAADYPKAAIRAGEEGVVAFRLAIGVDGRVTGCTITSSSGSRELDNATCSTMVRRARFEPARDWNGKRVPDVANHRIAWRISAPPPAPAPSQPQP